MNKNVTRLLSLALVCALAVPTAGLARTVSVAAVKDGAATAAFGDPDGAAYTLAWGYGPADGGASTNAWAHFETLGAVAADAVTTSVTLPAGWGDTVTHLRFFLLEPELPTEATRVEYLESSGTQWINSGVNLCSNDTVVADYQNPASIPTKSVDLFGVHKHGMTARYVFSYDSSSGTTTMSFHRANGIQGATSTATDVTATPGTRQTVTMKIGPGTSSIVSASGETLFSKTLTSQTVKQDATAPLAIFACNSSQYGIMALSAAKLYSFRIYAEDGSLRLDLVPCTVGGTPAMYDRVSGGYLTNVGTGDFVTGATMATPLIVAAASATVSASEFSSPDAYLDYVEATGTQWIDSGVNLRSNDTVVVDYGNPASILTKSVDLFGVHKSGLTARCVFSYSSGSSTIVFHKANGTQGATSTSTGVSVTPGTRQTVTMKLGAGTSSIVAASGERLYSGSLGGTIRQDATGPLYVFACNSSENGLMAISAAKLYSFRIYAEDGSLAHHFLPCRKGDAAALFDKQTGRILYPQGGALVAGPVLPRPAELVEWVQADGASGDRQLFLDTEVVGKAGVGMVAEMMWATKPAGDAVENIFCGATSSASKRFWLYDAAADAGSANATHRFVYNSWKLQLQSNNVARAGTRYRVETSLAAGAQYMHVGILDGTATAAERAYTDSAAIDTERTLYVFANNNAGSAEPVTAAARLYSLVLTNGLGVVRDFIPCVADNGRAGLYDRFSERVFFPQAAASGATSSDFDPATEIGAVTNSLVSVAEPPKRLRYIESDGTSDFVNLGVIGRENVKMVAEMEWAAVPPGNGYNNVFCGASANGVHIWPYIGVADANSSAVTPRMGYNGWRLQVTGTSIAADTRYRITTSLERKAQSILVEKFQNGTWVVDGEGARTNNDATWVNTQFPLYLFADNAAGTAANFVATRVYSLKLWQLNATSGEYELVRDLVPAKLDSGAAVLWDKVEARPLFNGARYGFADTGRETAWNGPGFMIRFW